MVRDQKAWAGSRSFLKVKGDGVVGPRGGVQSLVRSVRVCVCVDDLGGGESGRDLLGVLCIHNHGQHRRSEICLNVALCSG